MFHCKVAMFYFYIIYLLVENIRIFLITCFHWRSIPGARDWVQRRGSDGGGGEGGVARHGGRGHRGARLGVLTSGHCTQRCYYPGFQGNYISSEQEMPWFFNSPKIPWITHSFLAGKGQYFWVNQVKMRAIYSNPNTRMQVQIIFLTYNSNDVT